MYCVPVDGNLASENVRRPTEHKLLLYRCILIFQMIYLQ